MRIALLVFPGVQMLDVAGPMDVFHEAARQSGKKDAYQFDLVALEEGPVRADNGMLFQPTAAIDTLDRAVDTLLVTGSHQVQDVTSHPRLMHWLQRQAAEVRRLGSVCSGAWLLAHAGLLDGRRVTTHWNISASLARRFEQVQVEHDQIYLRDGNLYTSAGVTAGMDLALALVEEDLGRSVALAVARELVMFIKRPGGQAQFSAHLAAQTAQRNPIRQVQEWVLENLEEDLTVDQLAEQAGMSVRNFSRAFKSDTGETPADFVEAARLDAARRMLEETASPLKRVAARSGFHDQNSLRRAFVRRLGVTPGDYRLRFHPQEA
ncbi:transcriptional regulator, AraC family with amidase-like domain [Duganella sp. CF458]|uniref:GlxA family transcriptional regulator n=1 Tax=Duganella sp. CF458 TaxID=1884368 RepID=UPI0008F1B6CB|nr:GlxA family transcriptional regulator [Duganella sp. CF458]SFG54117.1 transcriptional regulator, AraC family with amidase-like domain [Duganella sp. CF458]